MADMKLRERANKIRALEKPISDKLGEAVVAYHDTIALVIAQNSTIEAQEAEIKRLREQIKDKDDVIQGYIIHNEYVAQSFCILLNLIRKQGWEETTENNYEFFEEDIFSILGIKSLAELNKFKQMGCFEKQAKLVEESIKLRPDFLKVNK